MKVFYVFLVLSQAIYITKGKNAWTFPPDGKLASSNIRQLEQIAKVTRNTENFPSDSKTNPLRLGRDMSPGSTEAKEFEEESDISKNESEVNNLVGEDENQTTRNLPQGENNEDSKNYNFYPSRGEVTGTRKTPVSIIYY